MAGTASPIDFEMNMNAKVESNTSRPLYACYLQCLLLSFVRDFYTHADVSLVGTSKNAIVRRCTSYDIPLHSSKKKHFQRVRLTHAYHPP